MFYPEIILNELETNLSGIEMPMPLTVDRWLASSVLQKSIRRNRVETAMRAAVTLWTADQKNFLRRLVTLPAEDCSATASTVVSAFTAIAASTWRKRHGDLKVCLLLVQKLAESAKCRAADELFMTVALSSHHAELRRGLANASDMMLADYAVDTSRSLPERAAAIWLLAGTKRYPADLMPMREGNFDMAKDVLQALGAPVALTTSCIAVAKRTEYPLALFLPLLWPEVNKPDGSVCIAHDVITDNMSTEGIPLESCDTYTRSGKASFRQLQRMATEFIRFSVAQIGVAVFNLEGRLLDRYPTSPTLHRLREEGE